MKYLKYFLIVLVSTSMVSYTSRTSKVSEGIYPGNLIPDTHLSDNAGNKLNFSQLKGEKFLVSFWTVYDAASHLENVRLFNAIKKENYPIKMISVSFDENESVFEKTIALDRLDTMYQYREAKGKSSEIFKMYRLNNGFKNYLVDENGVIIAMDLSPTKLRKLLD